MSKKLTRAEERQIFQERMDAESFSAQTPEQKALSEFRIKKMNRLAEELRKQEALNQ
ncbi:MAG: hypothetical protein GX666_03555 [Tissierellia bacterium]|nr:hypothetical protein [Tissierellia bacterium]